MLQEMMNSMSVMQLGIIVVGILSIYFGLAALNNGHFGGRFFGADRYEKPFHFWVALLGLFFIGGFAMWFVMTR